MLPFLALLSLMLVVGAKHDDRIVRIAEGRVRGSNMVSFQGRAFRAFQGIPYAEPPTGSRRFKPPQAMPPWRGVLNATYDGPVCPQMNSQNYTGDEDCLYLNVFAPKNARNYPVIVWIHGGSFMDGNGGILITGPQYLMDHDVVFVSFNYRLGTLGFISTGDDALPGNYGMKDCVEVLRWIRRNIKVFGGNPDLVTVFGYSSGGASAQSLTMSPLSKGLFHRVVFESGSALHNWAFKPSPLDVARQVAQLVGCQSTDTTINIAKCLKDAPAQQIVETLYSFPSWLVNYPEPYGLVVETQDDPLDPPFLTEAPTDLFRKGLIHKVPAITGDTAAEAVLVPYLANQTGRLKELDDRLGEVLLNRFLSRNASDEVLREVKEFYFDGRSAADVPFQSVLNLYSDVIFYYNTYQSIAAHSAATGMPVYVYMFSFIGRLNLLQTYLNASRSLGAAHADDLFYIVGREVPFPDGGPNADETRMIKRITKMVSDFALTGNPTPETTDLIPEKWVPKRGKGKAFPYLEIDKELTMKSGPFFAERMAFWDNVFAKLNRRDVKKGK